MHKIQTEKKVLVRKIKKINKNFSKSGFKAKTQLVVMHFNYNWNAEEKGERKIIDKRKIFFKSAQEMLKKTIKSPPVIDWKTNLVDYIIESKFLYKLNNLFDNDLLDGENSDLSGRDQTSKKDHARRITKSKNTKLLKKL